MSDIDVDWMDEYFCDEGLLVQPFKWHHKYGVERMLTPTGWVVLRFTSSPQLDPNGFATGSAGDREVMAVIPCAHDPHLMRLIRRSAWEARKAVLSPEKVTERHRVKSRWYQYRRGEME